MPKKKVTISVDDKVYSNFQKYCEENAIMLSKKLELVMKAIIKGKAKNLVVILFIGLFLMTLIYAFAFSDITQGDFNNGTYANTTHNGSAVVLVGGNLSGSYTSQIFDSTTSSTRWDNLSWNVNIPSLNITSIVLPLSGGYVNSNSSENTFSQQNISQINNSDLTYLQFSSSSGNPGYLRLNWTSIVPTNSTVKNVSITYVHKNQGGLSGGDYLRGYVEVGGQFLNVCNFTTPTIDTTEICNLFSFINTSDKLNNLNFKIIFVRGGGEKTEYANYIYLNVSYTAFSNITLNFRNCSSSNCSDGTWQNLNLSNLNLTNRYFQYKGIFTSDNSNITPQLFNVSVGYTILDAIPPNITINTPLNKTYNTNSILFNITAVDNTGVSSCWYSLNSGANNNSMTNSGNFWTATNSTMLQDSQTARFYCNDSFNNLNNTEARTFFIDSINPSVEIGKNISQVELRVGSININWTATDTNINTVIFNITYPNGSLLYNSLSSVGSIDLFSPNNLSVLGVYTINLLVNDSIGNANSTSSTFSVNDTFAPSLTIIHPEAKTYGINSSLPLNYSVSDFGVGVGSCWYNLKNSSNDYIISNTTLTNCQNTTFDSDGDGSYTITVSSNDSLGNEDSNNVSFSVVTTAPAINLIAPANNSYLNYTNNIYFNYTVDSGFPISVCQLWGDFTGTWQLNQTNLSTALSVNNFFRINLTEGNYNWGIVCNDTQNKKNNVNRTFSVDITNPSLIISQPTGTKTSRTGIPLTFSVGDFNLGSCWYNLTRWDGVLWIGYRGNTLINNCSLTSFDVADDYTYMFSLTANDSAGNTNYSNSSFSVDTSTPSGGNTGGSSGGGGSGGRGSAITPVISGTNKLEIGAISNLIVNLGDNKKMSLETRNAGTNFLNNCKLKPIGEYSSWIFSEGVKNLAAGEISDFSFSLNVPKDVESGIFSITLSLECQETSKDTKFSVEVIKKKLGFDLIKVERFAEDKVKVNFFLEELSGIEQQVNIQFLFFGSDNKKVAEVEQDRTLSANTKEEAEIIVPIDSSLEGELNLLININSETYSTFVQENIILGSYVSGFTIFWGEKGRVDSIISLLLILLFLVFAYFIIKRILHHKKSLEHEIKREKKKKLRKKHGFFKKLYWKFFSKKDKRGVMLIDNKILELLKRESSGKDLRGKWIDLSVKK